MSSTLAGNLTVLGSVANLIVLQQARHQVKITFWEYTRVGSPLTLLTIVIGVANNTRLSCSRTVRYRKSHVAPWTKAAEPNQDSLQLPSYLRQGRTRSFFGVELAQSEEKRKPT